MMEQAAIAVVNAESFGQLLSLLENAFAERDVEVLLDRVNHSKFGIREFEKILGRGWLGKEAAAHYGALPVSDQAQTRERYNCLVEAVSPELRFRYRKAYTR